MINLKTLEEEVYTSYIDMENETLGGVSRQTATLYLSHALLLLLPVNQQ